MKVNRLSTKIMVASLISFCVCASMRADRIEIMNHVPDVAGRNSTVYVAIYVKSKNMITRKGAVRKVESGKPFKINRPKENFELAIAPERGKKHLMKEFEVGSDDYINLKRVNVSDAQKNVMINIKNSDVLEIDAKDLIITVE